MPAYAILSLMLIMSLGANAYLAIARIVENSYAGDIIKIRASYLDAYDHLVCDLICGKSLDEANKILAPNRVARFKQRRDFGQLSIGNTIVDLCLDGDFITAVDSSSDPDEKLPCVMAAHLLSSSGSQDEQFDNDGVQQ
jgi:hypothetical protein